MADSISLAQARRIALGAAGFADPRPSGRPDARHLRRVVGRIGVLQIDSVNVLQRAHYLPLYSRLGPYPVRLLDRAAYERPSTLFEYWGHEASLLPVALHPLLRWRMARDHGWGGVARIALEQPELVRRVLDDVRAEGPATAAQIEGEVTRRAAAANWGWMELVGREAGAGVALLARRNRRGVPQRGLRPRVRPARAGPPAAGPGRADARARRCAPRPGGDRRSGARRRGRA